MRGSARMPPSTLKRFPPTCMTRSRGIETLCSPFTRRNLVRTILFTLSPPVSGNYYPHVDKLTLLSRIHVFGKNRSTLVRGQNTNSDLLGVSYSMLTVWRHHVKRRENICKGQRSPP
ncbi:hypothetical protein BDQ94DRAFT_143376 [Aspergillus welwitschiae]|uniref:Uncharacterized protein n=1 Tax=Aspergillus welwitschiae TaxID=1341132 RepID=A0A3F3Q3B8_9EURO|nr:hypothetical protein BDQ94DRAFT_143376 [Aspergillus welwitschiae]RDH33585.1 hypothetical protein BDQ94DRAFT_143376 [Aspergillus welwitschiae]